MAIAKPPNVSVLIEMLKNLKIIAVIIIDNGIAVNVIMVVLKFNKNKNRIIITKIKPSLSACSTLVSELVIKLLWLKTSVLIFTSGGNDV